MSRLYLVFPSILQPQDAKDAQGSDLQLGLMCLLLLLRLMLLMKFDEHVAH